MPKSIAPIKPQDVSGQQDNAIPDEVIEVFNELIIKNCRNGYAHILQKDVVALMVKKGMKREDIFNNRWLDVEGIFRKNGWKVEYDKPAWCESYEPSFKFSAKKSSD